MRLRRPASQLREVPVEVGGDDFFIDLLF